MALARSLIPIQRFASVNLIKKIMIILQFLTYGILYGHFMSIWKICNFMIVRKNTVNSKLLKGTLMGVFLAGLSLGLFSFVLIVRGQNEKDCISKRFTVMGLGDSITEGGSSFHSYLFPLWEKLYAAGYNFEFIGPNSARCRIGTISHSGFSGKNAEFLEAHIDSIYRQYPADIVLLHAGHNHFEHEDPVAGIISAQESIIRKIRAINPRVIILVAQVIPSGKLPKYAYIPELNREIAKMVKRLNSKNIVLIDQSNGFDWKKYTISDHVHPNPAGAEKMAGVWFEALSKVLGPTGQTYTPEIYNYKQLDSADLKLHVFKPGHLKREDKRAAVVYFFGGGWAVGTPLQFYRECAYYASRGMIAVSAEYRISAVHHSTPFESLEDARDAIRWLREHASELNLDPDRIAAAGASAGGHLAAATGIIREDPQEKQRVSSKPNLLLLYYPVIDNSENGYGPEEMKKRYREISPLQNIDSTASPALFILGTKDPLIPVQTAEEFKRKMEENGVTCELHLIEGAGHPIFYYRKPLTDEFYRIRKITDDFLEKYGYLH